MSNPKSPRAAATDGRSPPSFDLGDLEAFSIPDGPTRLSALQFYLFPKLDHLVEETISLIQQVYNVKVSDRYSPLHHPKFRKSASKPQSTDQVMSGLSPSRDNVPTRMLKKDGSPYVMGPGELMFRIRSFGALQAVWLPYAWADSALMNALHGALSDYWPALQYLLASSNVCSRCDDFRIGQLDTLLDKSAIWQGPAYPLPILTTYGRRRLMAEHVLLFPLFDAGTRLARGEPHNLEESVDRLLAWAETLETWLEPSVEQREEEASSEAVGRPVVRNRKRWSVFVRDNWTCCGCGRTPRDGYSLEVDHIVPRSKGGSDADDNLQTLCWPCNSGKSNLDQTDLRR